MEYSDEIIEVHRLTKKCTANFKNALQKIKNAVQKFKIAVRKISSALRNILLGFLDVMIDHKRRFNTCKKDFSLADGFDVADLD